MARALGLVGSWWSDGMGGVSVWVLPTSVRVRDRTGVAIAHLVRADWPAGTDDVAAGAVASGEPRYLLDWLAEHVGGPWADAQALWHAACAEVDAARAAREGEWDGA